MIYDHLFLQVKGTWICLMFQDQTPLICFLQVIKALYTFLYFSYFACVFFLRLSPVCSVTPVHGVFGDSTEKQNCKHLCESARTLRSQITTHH